MQVGHFTGREPRAQDWIVQALARRKQIMTAVSGRSTKRSETLQLIVRTHGPYGFHGSVALDPSWSTAADGEVTLDSMFVATVGLPGRHEGGHEQADRTDVVKVSQTPRMCPLRWCGTARAVTQFCNQLSGIRSITAASLRMWRRTL